jgi:aspartyl-tRNA(Asn)/glutamyl-tRNA(Gln) amidotransferase subunit A
MATEAHVYALAIAASVLLSFYPFVIVMLGFFRNVLHWRAGEAAVYLALNDALPGDLGAFIRRNPPARGSVQIVSMVLLLFTANGVFEPLEVALNRAWGVTENRSYLKNQLVALGMIFACGGLALLSLMFTSWVAALNGPQGAVQSFANLLFFKIAALPLSILALFLVYWLLPNRKVDPVQVALQPAGLPIRRPEAPGRVRRVPTFGHGFAMELCGFAGRARRSGVERPPQPGCGRMTLREAAQALRERSVSSVELTRAALDRIERLNPTLNAFLEVLTERALDRAAQADRDLRAGDDRGPLHGIPIGLKDLFDMRGVRTTAGSRIYDYIAKQDSTVVEKLEAAGAVIVGKQNMHELAYGITSANPHFGPVRNPWNPDHIPGGSSGGSGAAVAAGMVFAAIGTDTGGSIRIPAAFCGVVGLKPTYGLVSRFGAVPLSPNLDHFGPFARNVRDAATVLNAVAGYDPRDETSIEPALMDYVPQEGCSIRGLRIGFDEKCFGRIDPEVDAPVRAALAAATSMGAQVRPVHLPDLAAVNTVGLTILLAEATAMAEPYLNQRDHFGADVLELLDKGRLVPATEYIHAQRARRKLEIEFRVLWSQVDCLILPSIPIPPPRIGELTVQLAGEDEPVRPVVTRLTRPLNVLGLPAISIPCGLSSAGLPIGLQIAGPELQEALVLRIAAALEDCGVGVPPCPV